MSDIATEIKETQAVSTPEKEVKPVEKEVVKENDVTEKDEKKEEEKTKEQNGGAPEESENDDKEEPTTENEDSTDVSDKCAIKRKSVGGGDVTDNGEEKKAKLDEEAPAEAVTNGV